MWGGLNKEEKLWVSLGRRVEGLEKVRERVPVLWREEWGAELGE